MKTILLYLLLSTSDQTLIYNMPTNQYYVVDVETKPIQILIIEENIETIPACIQKKYRLKDINFTNNSSCLIHTLNDDFNLSINQYVDLKDQYTNKDLIELKKGNISLFYHFLTTIEHSFSISNLYQIYLDAKKNEFQYEIHSFTYIKINDTYVPIAYPLNGLSKVITE